LTKKLKRLTVLTAGKDEGNSCDSVSLVNCLLQYLERRCTYDPTFLLQSIITEIFNMFSRRHIEACLIAALFVREENRKQTYVQL
jgi:hypothetical protein